jgi:hypothetical protein
VAETVKNFYATSFDALVKRWTSVPMWWRICREVNVSPLQVVTPVSLALASHVAETRVRLVARRPLSVYGFIPIKSVDNC